MRSQRQIIITLDSALTPVQFSNLLDELTEEVEQAACDYAAVCDDDDYTVAVEVKLDPRLT